MHAWRLKVVEDVVSGKMAFDDHTRKGTPPTRRYMFANHGTREETLNSCQIHARVDMEKR